MLHPVADFISRIQRKENDQVHHAAFKLVGTGVPEMEFTEKVKVFGDVIEIREVDGADYFVPVHQIRYLSHQLNPDGESKGWCLFI